jgi:hypothetical protein
MSDEAPTATGDLEDILDRLRESHEALQDAIGTAEPEDFLRESDGEDSAKRILDRAVDEVNHYYGRLVAKAVSLPQPPYMEDADFGTLDEASAAMEEAHKRFVKLLHDLSEDDLDKTASLENTAEYTLRQVLETSAAHYKLRADQIKNLSGPPKKTRRRRTT